MNPTTAETIQLSNEEIEKVAHSIWEQEGRPEGRSLEHWLIAENQLRNQKQVQDSTDRNPSSVVAPAEPSVEKNTRGSKGEVNTKRQSAPPLAPPNRIGKAA